MRVFCFSMICGLSLMFGTGAVHSAGYPERTVTIVVPFAAGGTTDILARLMANHMSKTLGQQLIVENVAGAGGTTGVTRVSKSAPDGYTLLMGNLGTQVASIALYPNLAYDPRTDFVPIMNSGGTPMLVVVKKDLPVKDFREFVAYLKTNGPKMNYGTGGVGATSHLTCLYLSALLGVDPQHVPFRGSGPALTALMSGDLDYVCDQTVGVISQVNSNQVKGLVVAVPNRVPVMPNIPTSIEQGFPEFQASGWNAMFAPKGTPKEIVEQLNAAARAAMKDDAIRQRLLDLGVELPDEAGQTQEALAKLVSNEIDKWVPIIKKAGVTAQ